MEFAISSLRTIDSWFFQRTQTIFTAQWVRCSSKFLFPSMFAGRFSYLLNNFHITASAFGLSFFPGSQEVRGKISFRTCSQIQCLQVYTQFNIALALWPKALNVIFYRGSSINQCRVFADILPPDGGWNELLVFNLNYGSICSRFATKARWSENAIRTSTPFKRNLHFKSSPKDYTSYHFNIKAKNNGSRDKDLKIFYQNQERSP